MPETEEARLYRVQPDRPPTPLPDVGVHSWPIGSYMPMGIYRPVPIVHFTGVVVTQGIAQVVLHDLLYTLPGEITVGACALVALVLALAGLRRLAPGGASTAWKLATAIALSVNLLLVSLASFAPSRNADEPPQVEYGTGISDHFRPG